MDIRQAVRLSDTACLALVGAGGKTTTLFQLARILRYRRASSSAGSPGRPVIVTATTHLHINQARLADSHWIVEKPADLAGFEKNLCGVMLVTGPLEGDRTSASNDQILSRLRSICDSHALPLIIEADGARLRPLKAPALHEPPIPEFVETVVVVAGLAGLGKPLTDGFVHRPEIFASLSGLANSETITSEALRRVLIHPAGGLKNIPPMARRIILLNQADTMELQSQAKSLAESLLGTFNAVIIASLEQSQIHAVHEPVAGIILAGGESKRFGRPKQLLNYHGQPFVRAVAQTALASGLSPVVLVSGAYAEEVESALQDLPITITCNANWQKGQSSSIQAGLQAIRHPVFQAPSPKFEEIGGGWQGVGAAIFLLADQPQVTPTFLNALVERHAIDLPAIVAPLVAGQRANPVLFDRNTFPDLLELTGDVGGRAIFPKHPVTFLTWHDERLLLDVDTENDYQRLQGSEN